MELNKVYPEDCFVTIKKIIEEGIKVNNIITELKYLQHQNHHPQGPFQCSLHFLLLRFH